MTQDQEFQEFADISGDSKKKFLLRDLFSILNLEIPPGRLKMRHFLPVIGGPLYNAEHFLFHKLIKRNNYDYTARDNIILREAQVVIGPVFGGGVVLGHMLYPFLF